MKKILTLVLVSALGGLITLGSYKLYFEKESDLAVKSEDKPQFVVPVNNTNNRSINSNVNTPSFVDAADKTLDAVVHVKNTAIVSGQNSFEDFFFGRSSQRAQVGTGSGVIIDAQGYIVTNNHVIAGARDISITLNNNKTYTAELVGTDPKTDIALLKIEPDEALPFLTFGDSDQAKIGEWVLAVGNPFNLTSTVTAGIISAKSRDLSGKSEQSFIQTDAAVNPGNSGGALVNTNGDLIGINTAITSQTGSYVGYSFAVPSNIARKIVYDIMEFGSVQNVVLGIRGGALNGKVAEELNTDETEGFYVSGIESDSGAEKAGIKSGDIIKKLDQIEINKFSDLSGYLKTKQPNDIVDVTLLRDGDTKIVPVKLIKNETQVVPMVGLVKPATKKDLKRYDLEYGVKISNLTDNKRLSEYWKNNNVEEGSIILSINEEKVSSIDDVKRIIDSRSDYEPLTLEIMNIKGEKDRFYFR
ncbi:trypsin-like peptidase domain-containing protein [Ichthyenterobacterium sp. W332]|uniref:Trypsin-like peptidase domain-containing protein n=1 Tax=Microcosmobacter mediterraneus TaxID=3075607 RepID=A0ABU2YH64_9FLAO|nr:trypsin-like peptidase domain-containing protein [Ichthyenterobacterium sp. W332]MDT0557510.1 trypsin-like peptidase domain-containing protein [Ichthyenterobacterium sp. W332]